MSYFLNIHFYCLIIYLLIQKHAIENVNNNINDENKCIIKSLRQ